MMTMLMRFWRTGERDSRNMQLVKAVSAKAIDHESPNCFVYSGLETGSKADQGCKISKKLKTQSLTLSTFSATITLSIAL
jgi:hypothetical protein